MGIPCVISDAGDSAASPALKKIPIIIPKGVVAENTPERTRILFSGRLAFMMVVDSATPSKN